MSSGQNRRQLLQAGLAWLMAAPVLRAAGPDRTAPFRLYVMDTGLVGPDVPTLEKKVELARELGFAGIGYTLHHDALPRLLELLDRAGLELSAVYTTPRLEDRLDPGLASSIRRMKGRRTRIEMAISSGRLRPSDPAGDELGTALLRQVSDLAADTGPVVSVYPHRGSWTERVEDGLRLADKVGRKNVGTHFNLVHWKWVGSRAPLPQLLEQALPHLFSVTINGLQGDTIVSLDQGNYDLLAFLKLLKKVGYTGPVGLQAYSVPGPSREHLARSLRRWRELLSKLQ